MWDDLIIILKDKKTINILNSNKFIRLIDISYDNIIIQTPSGKNRTISKKELEDSYDYIQKNGKLSIYELTILFSTYNSRYVASILATLDNVFYDFDPSLILYSKNYDFELNQSYKVPDSENDDFELNDKDLFISPGNMPKDRRARFMKAIKSKSRIELECLSCDEDSSVREAVAANPNTPPDILSNLIMDKDILVIRSLAKNNSTPVDVLEYLTTLEDKIVWRNVAGNPSTTSHILEELFEKNDLILNREIAKNIKTPPYILFIYSKNEDNIIRRTVAQNPNTPPEALEILSNEIDFDNDDEFLVEYPDTNFLEENSDENISKDQYEKGIFDKKEFLRDLNENKNEYDDTHNKVKLLSNEARTMLDNLNKAYKILYKILLLPESDWKTKIYANTALSYFINPHDLIPESEKGIEGYLDDFYICLEVLRDLKKYRSTLINKISPQYIYGDLDSFLEENIEYCKIELKDKIIGIRELVGYDSLVYFDLGNTQYTDKSSTQMHTRAKLIGVIAYLYDEISKNIDSVKVYNYLNDLSLSEEFFDILRITNKYYSNEEIYSFYDGQKFEEIFRNYEAILKNIKNTKYDAILNKSLPIFKTLCNILEDKECTWKIKHEINCALSYFALVEDIIHDSADSGIGFIDDLFISSFVLFDISEINTALVKNNLAEDIEYEDIYPILANTMDILESSNIQHAPGKIINLLGLKGLLAFYDLSETDKNFTISNKILDNKIKTILVDLLKFYLKTDSFVEIYNKSLEDTIDYLFNQGTPESIQKLNLFIEIATEISYNQNIEKEIYEKEESEARAIMLKYRILSE